MLRFIQCLARRADNQIFAGDEILFKRGACGNRSERCGNACYRTIEVIESLLLNLSCNLSSDAALFDGFVDDNQVARFLD